MISVFGWGFFHWLPSNNDLAFLFLYDIIKNFQIPYFAYIFAKVSKDHIPAVSSFTHAAVFAGNFIGTVFIQLILNRTISSVQTIFYLIFIVQIIATLIVVCLPKLDRIASPLNLCNYRFWVFEQLKFACTNYRICIWSLWFIVGPTILTLETTLLGYTRWDADLQSPTFYLGELLGIFLTLLACFVIMKTKRHALIVLIVVSLASGGLMFLAADASSSSMQYILLELLKIICRVTVTLAR